MTFAYSLTVKGTPWDVYYFEKDGKPGTLAYYKNEHGVFVLGLFCEGKLRPGEVQSKLHYRMAAEE